MLKPNTALRAGPLFLCIWHSHTNARILWIHCALCFNWCTHSISMSLLSFLALLSSSSTCQWLAIKISVNSLTYWRRDNDRAFFNFIHISRTPCYNHDLFVWDSLFFPTWSHFVRERTSGIVPPRLWVCLPQSGSLGTSVRYKEQKCQPVLSGEAACVVPHAFLMCHK